MKKTAINYSIATLFLVAFSIYPQLAYAQFVGLKSFIVAFGGIISQLLLIVAALGLLVFFWGLVKFISKAGDETTHTEGRQFMVWGIVALFVMVSVWGIVRFIQLNLGIQSGGIFRIEGLDPSSGAGGSRGWQSGPPTPGQTPPRQPPIDRPPVDEPCLPAGQVGPCP